MVSRYVPDAHGAASHIAALWSIGHCWRGAGLLEAALYQHP
jgi:hypothetical protein